LGDCVSFPSRAFKRRIPKGCRKGGIEHERRNPRRSREPAELAEGNGFGGCEGVSGADGTLHPMQQAFIEHDAFQCGYCTPGQIMSAIACVSEGHANTADEIREHMSGNLCRCAAIRT